MGEKPSTHPTVTAFDVVGGAEPLLLKVADTVSSSPHRTVTLFDASEKPAAAYKCKALRHDDGGAVLYARDAPDLSNGKKSVDTEYDMLGQAICPVPTSTDVNGVLMRAVGCIKMIRTASASRVGLGGEPSSDGSIDLGYGLFFLGADGTFNTKAGLFFDE